MSNLEQICVETKTFVALPVYIVANDCHPEPLRVRCVYSKLMGSTRLWIGIDSCSFVFLSLLFLFLCWIGIRRSSTNCCSNNLVVCHCAFSLWSPFDFLFASDEEDNLL